MIQLFTGALLKQTRPARLPFGFYISSPIFWWQKHRANARLNHAWLNMRLNSAWLNMRLNSAWQWTVLGNMCAVFLCC